MAAKDLWKLCGRYGKVVDVFISSKVRPNKKEAFGFVRFQNQGEAEMAIEKLNGWVYPDAKIKRFYG